MEKHLTRSFFLTFFLYNDFLRIGDDDIKVGIINCMENCPCLIQKMELDIGIKNTGILWRHHLCFIKGHDFAK